MTFVGCRALSVLHGEAAETQQEAGEGSGDSRPCRGLCVYDVREIDVGIIKHRNPAVESQSLALGFPSITFAEIAPDHLKLSVTPFSRSLATGAQNRISIELRRI